MKVAFNNHLLMYIIISFGFIAILPLIAMFFSIPIKLETIKYLMFSGVGCIVLFNTIAFTLLDNYLVFDINKGVFYNISTLYHFTVYKSNDVDTRKLLKLYLIKAPTGRYSEVTDSLYADFYGYDVSLSKYNPSKEYHEIMVERAKSLANCLNVSYELKVQSENLF